MSAGTSQLVIAFARQAPQRFPLLRRPLLVAAVAVQPEVMSASEAPR